MSIWKKGTDYQDDLAAVGQLLGISPDNSNGTSWLTDRKYSIRRVPTHLMPIRIKILLMVTGEKILINWDSYIYNIQEAPGDLERDKKKTFSSLSIQKTALLVDGEMLGILQMLIRIYLMLQQKGTHQEYKTPG